MVVLAPRRNSPVFIMQQMHLIFQSLIIFQNTATMFKSNFPFGQTNLATLPVKQTRLISAFQLLYMLCYGRLTGQTTLA